HLERVGEAVVHQHFVVEMRASRQAGEPDIADHLTLSDLDALLDARGEDLLMRIRCFIAVAMPDTDVIAIAAMALGDLDGPVAGRQDRGADRRGPVDAGVHLAHAQKRMPAEAETGGETSGLDRGLYEELPGIGAPVVIEIHDAFRCAEPVISVGRA